MLRKAETGVTLAFAMLLGSLHAQAMDQPIRAELDWRTKPAGSNCIDRDELRSAVEERLGRQVFTDRATADVRVVGGIDKQGDVWRVQIRLSSSHGEPMGERELESEAEDCSALDASLALVLAVMLDLPKAKVPQPTADAPPRAVEPPRAPARPTRLRVPRETPPSRPAWPLELGVSGLVTSGLVPGPAWGGQLHVAIDPASFWKLGVVVAVYRSVEQTVEGTRAGASFAPLEAGWFFCPLAWPSGRARVEACLVQHVGRLRVEGFGFDVNQTQTRTYANLGAELDGRLELSGPLSARLALRLQAPLLRETFRYGAPSGSEPSLFRMAPALVTGQVGLVARF